MFIYKHIDTLYLSIKCGFSDCETLVKKIKNYLSCNVTQNGKFLEVLELSRSRNKWYANCLSNAELGFFMYTDPRQNTKNYPIYIELGGKFFRYPSLSESFLNFLNELPKEFKDVSLVLDRIDVDCDVNYIIGDFDNASLSKGSFYPLGFPIPTLLQFSGCQSVAAFEGHFYASHNYSYPIADTIYIGRNDTKLKVYDKDLELAKSAEVYKDVYGFECEIIRTFRIEFMLRGQSLKGFIGKLKSYDFGIILNALIDYVNSRYTFEFNGVSEYVLDSLALEPLDVFSLYSARSSEGDEKSLIEQIHNNENQLRKYWKKQLKLEGIYNRIRQEHKSIKNFVDKEKYRAGQLLHGDFLAEIFEADFTRGDENVES